MTLTIFIAVCLLGCGFMQYVLIRWIRDEQLQAQTMRGECKEQGRKQPHTMTAKKTSPTKVNVPTVTSSWSIWSMGRGSSSQVSTVQNALTPRKKG
jgi:hypothetical protein